MQIWDQETFWHYLSRVLGSCQSLMPAHFSLVLGFVVKRSHSLSMLGYFPNLSSTYLSICISFSFVYIRLCCIILIICMGEFYS